MTDFETDETVSPTGTPPKGDAIGEVIRRHQSRVAGEGIGYEQQFNDVHTALFGEPVSTTRIGRFTVLEKLGEGGMGMVYAAYDPDLDRKVAIKLVRSNVKMSDEHRSRMRREAQAMARLSHPNVVQVFEVGEYEQELFVAMEFVRGQTLGSWLAGSVDRTGARKGRSWREVVEVFLAAARGLAAAHKAGIIHRDFKPETPGALCPMSEPTQRW